MTNDIEGKVSGLLGDMYIAGTVKNEKARDLIKTAILSLTTKPEYENPFLDCSKDCKVIKELGAGECENVYPEKFKVELDEKEVELVLLENIGWFIQEWQSRPLRSNTNDLLKRLSKKICSHFSKPSVESLNKEDFCWGHKERTGEGWFTNGICNDCGKPSYKNIPKYKPSVPSVEEIEKMIMKIAAYWKIDKQDAGRELLVIPADREAAAQAIHNLLTGRS